jgi:hypothetical protein
MRGTLRKSVMAAAALLIVAGTTVAVPNSASARDLLQTCVET